jgi:hypothetical protein
VNKDDQNKLSLLFRQQFTSAEYRSEGHGQLHYGRYIPNLARQDGSALERQWATGFKGWKIVQKNRHSFGHNQRFWLISPF